MRDANYAIAAVIVGTFVLTWTLGRLVPRLHYPLVIVWLVVLRLCIALIAGIAAAQSAIAGGFWWLVVPVLGILSLFSLAMAGVVVWGATRDELRTDA